MYTENVLLGFATNLSPERIEVLSKTLRSIYSPNECDLVIYTNNVNRELSYIAKEHSVNFLYTPNTYSFSVNKISKLLNRIIINSTNWLARYTCNFPSLKIIFYEAYPLLIKLWHHPHFVRWLCYKEFFDTHRNYKKVCISDVKDVAFQAPFFEKLDSSVLHLFEQDVFYGIFDGHNRYDTLWYRDAYGLKELNKIKDKPALCEALLF